MDEPYRFFQTKLVYYVIYPRRVYVGQIFVILYVSFTNGPGVRGSIPGRVIPKTQKMVLDVSLRSTQRYKVRTKGKMEQSKEWSSAPPLHLGVVAIEKGAFGSPSTMVTNFTFIYICLFFKFSLCIMLFI